MQAMAEYDLLRSNGRIARVTHAYRIEGRSEQLSIALDSMVSAKCYHANANDSQ